MSFWECQLAACSCELYRHFCPFNYLNMDGLQIEVSPTLRNNISSEAEHLEANDGSQEGLESLQSNVLSNLWDVHKRTHGA